MHQNIVGVVTRGKRGAYGYQEMARAGLACEVTAPTAILEWIHPQAHGVYSWNIPLQKREGKKQLFAKA